MWDKKNNSHEKPLFWLGHRGEDAEIVSEFINLSGVICCDYSPYLEKLSQGGTRVYSEEFDTGIRSPYSSSSTDTKWLEQMISSHTILMATDKRPCLISYSPIPENKYNWRSTSISYNLFAKINDKRWQRLFFKSHSIPSPPTLFISSQSKKNKLNKFFFKFDGLVIQPAVGSQGKNVHKISSATWQEAIGQIIPKCDNSWIASPFYDGITFNCHVCILKAETIISSPSVQLIGLKDGIGLSKFSYCGNDFYAPHLLDQLQRKKLINILCAIADNLRCYGYLGLVGIDLILAPKHGWLVLELNPRMQASTLPLCLLERREGYMPASSYHLEALELLPDTKKRKKIGFPSPIDGMNLTIFQGSYTSSQNIEASACLKKTELKEDWLILGQAINKTTANPQSQKCRLLGPSCCCIVSDTHIEISLPHSVDQIIRQGKVFLPRQESGYGYKSVF